MIRDRHITLRVEYERDPRYGRSLEWIAPELKDTGLTLTEDRTSEATPSRTWTGTVDAAAFERFAAAWGLDEATNEPAADALADDGAPPVHEFTFDGMNWEAGGESPIVYVSVSIGAVPHGRAAETRELLPFTYIG
jgi:hypothetical protein